MAKNEYQKRIAEKNRTKDWRKVEGLSRAYFLDELRRARLAAQKDAESFDELLFVFERLGCFRLAEAATLGKYEESLLDLAAESALGGSLDPRFAHWHSDKSDLYTLVTEARNDAQHQGAGARHLTEHAIELALLFEDALVNGKQPVTDLRDIMVRSPVTAEPWQPICFVRQIMLTNSFSTLPLYFKEEWQLVTDAKLAAFLRAGDPKGAERGARLGMSLEEAHKKDRGLFEKATLKKPEDKIDSIAIWFSEKRNNALVLVCAEEAQDSKEAPRLLGIVTAFDIL